MKIARTSTTPAVARASSTVGRWASTGDEVTVTATGPGEAGPPPPFWISPTTASTVCWTFSTDPPFPSPKIGDLRAQVSAIARQLVREGRELARQNPSEPAQDGQAEETTTSVAAMRCTPRR